jgi:hypothetical protein
MIRLFQIAVFSCAAIVLAGCDNPDKPPDLKGVKIGDLAPSGGEKSVSPLLKTVTLDLVTFEISADRISSLDAVWSMLQTEPLRLADANAFAENRFRIGAGQGRMLDKVGSALISAGGRKLGTTLLLIPDGQSETLNIARLTRRLTISYVASPGSLRREELGPGGLALRITARRLGDSRALCNINAVPVFSPSTEGLAPQLATRIRAGEFYFSPIGFSIRVRPGDFLVLAPREYIADRSTLAGLFFGTPTAKPSVTVYVLICTGV